jgi:dihydroorotase
MELKKKVNNEKLNTKCGWNPFHGRELKGWPVTTIINGNIIYNSWQVNDEVKGREVEYSNE